MSSNPNLIYFSMFEKPKRQVTIAHLTGSAKIVSNEFNESYIIPRERRSVVDMFLAPYESSDEFFFCLQHTLIPTLCVAAMLLDPANFIFIPPVVLAAAAICLVVEKIAEYFELDGLAEVANFLRIDCSQSLVDILMLPASSLSFLTRSISSMVDYAHSSINHTVDDEILADKQEVKFTK